MISITLPFPPSVNGLYANVAGKGRVKSKRYLTWCVCAGTEIMRWRAGQNRRGQKTAVKGPVAIEIVLQKKDNRKRDLDNHAKALLDHLVEHQIIDDDRNVVDLRLTWATNGEIGATVYVRAA